MNLPRSAKHSHQVREVVVDSTFAMEVRDTFVSGTLLKDFFEKDTDSSTAYATFTFQEITITVSKMEPEDSDPILGSSMYVGNHEVSGYPLLSAYVPTPFNIIYSIFDMINNGSYQKNIEDAVSQSTWQKLVVLARSPEVSSAMMALLIGVHTSDQKSTVSSEKQKLIANLTKDETPVPTFNNMYNHKYMDRIMLILDKSFSIGVHPKFESGVRPATIFKKDAAMVVIGFDGFSFAAYYSKQKNEISYTVYQKKASSSASVVGNLTVKPEGKLPMVTTYVYDLIRAFDNPMFLKSISGFLSLTSTQENTLRLLGEGADITTMLLLENLYNPNQDFSLRENLLN